MSLPRVVAVGEGSPAARAGLRPGDELLAVAGQVPRDVIDYEVLVDGDVVDLDVVRDGRALRLAVEKAPGEPLGAVMDGALFDRVRTCDNHCAFCFIHQLPKGMRRSLYLRDDDYRLSFLYGNFTTLTRFTEADLERVVTEGLSPLYVSIHATDPAVRARLLRNRRGATSLRFLRALLDHGIEVHGQVVVCPGLNDGAVLEDTMAGVLDEYPELASVALVPVGVSRHARDPELRPHTVDEAAAVVELVEEWQALFLEALGRRVVFAADEFYLLAGLPFPPLASYEGLPQLENGVGMARAFEAGFLGGGGPGGGPRGGFFASVDGAPAAGYRAPRRDGDRARARAEPTSARRPTAVVTGAYGAAVLGPLLERVGRDDVRLVVVDNAFFGGNVAVTGLLVGEDVGRALAVEPEGHRYLLPDVCLSYGRFLDGTTPEDLPRPVEVVPTDGRALRDALGGPR
jgi:NifB/MoaA-like Fe-S oxidoreductase